MPSFVETALLTSLCLVSSPTLAQLAPTGAHYAARPSDTGYGSTLVNATGAFGANLPLDLPAERAGLPIPLQVVYGTPGVGAAGLGWEVPLSYLLQDRTLAHRRPEKLTGVDPVARQHTTLMLLGQPIDLIRTNDIWVSRSGTLELIVRQVGSQWQAYDGMGRTYTFEQPAGLANTGLWVLKTIAGAGGAVVELTYAVQAEAVDDGSTPLSIHGGSGISINLIQIDYDLRPPLAPNLPTGCAKNRIVLNYGNTSTAPYAAAILDSSIRIRKDTLVSIEVKSRASCNSPMQRIRRYELQYMPDADTSLPRLQSVRLWGRDGTPEGTTPLPIANYTYGSAKNVTDNRLHYTLTQTIPIPSEVSTGRMAGTVLDSSVNAPVAGDRYAMWQTLTDFTGDGRPDLVFKKNGKLWVAYDQPGPNGTTLLGSTPQTLVQLSDATLSQGPVYVHTTEKRRFQYGPANRNTTNVWREAIDVNGDGRVDIVDAAEEPYHWVIYLNTPGPNGVVWQRRSIRVSSLGAMLERAGHHLDGGYVPLARRSTGRSLREAVCWRWDPNAHHWVWDPGGVVTDCHVDHPNQVKQGPERTIVEWEFLDLNGDGYPDFLFDSTPVDWQRPEPSPCPQQTCSPIGGQVWLDFEPSPANAVRAAFNVVGVRFDFDQDAFSRDIDLQLQAPSLGVEFWGCGSDSCDETQQEQFAGLMDINGDGLVDRIEGGQAYLGVFAGAGAYFSATNIALPGRMAAIRNNYDAECLHQGGQQHPQSSQIQGVRDLTGDGIPDFYGPNPQGIGPPVVWIGTGVGFTAPVQIATTTWQWSHQTETCDGKESWTDGGLFDVSAEGKPQVITTNGSVFWVFSLVDGSNVRVPEAGRLTTVDNGYGAQTRISYVSAKDYTDNPLPFPEIVVSAVTTAGTQNFGGSLAGSRYAYSNAELIFDSALDRFVFSGYRRLVELDLFGPPAPLPTLQVKAIGNAIITDRWPLTPFNIGLTQHERWIREQRQGQISDLTTVHGLASPDPWQLLTITATDPRVTGVSHFGWDAKYYEIPFSSPEDTFDCVEMFYPYDYDQSVGANFGSNYIDVCRAHGFGYPSVTTSWRGSAPPPSDQNVQTRTQVLAVDDFGHALRTQYLNDVVRNDDDLCVQQTFATPTEAYPRVVSAVASRTLAPECGKNLTIASESWTYDHLPAGQVSEGRVTSHSVDRRATDTGAVLGTIHVFDAAYDSVGNLSSVVTTRDAATRTITFHYDDPFKLMVTAMDMTASGVPAQHVQMSFDPFTLDRLTLTDANGTTWGATYDGFGRQVRSTLTPVGGALGVLSTSSYLGFDGTDPNGRRISGTEYDDPVPPAQLASAQGRNAVLYLDEMGRPRHTEVVLGSSYGNESLIVGAKLYDPAGRVSFAADPFPKSQSIASAYGSSFFYTDTGDLDCVIRGTGVQMLVRVSDPGTEHFPTCFVHSYQGHTELLDVQDASSLQAGSPQQGVLRHTVRTAIGREIERSSWDAGVRLEDATFAYDRLGQLASVTRYADPVTPSQGTQWYWRRDSRGQILELHEPEMATRFYRYSNWGEPVETRWTVGAQEHQLVRVFDALGRLTESEALINGIADPETQYRYEYDTGAAISPLVSPTYVLGRLARAKSPHGQSNYSYDAQGRINAQVFADDAAQLYIEKRQYRANGMLASLQFQLPDRSYQAEVATYAYDSADRLRKVDFSDGASSVNLYSAGVIDLLGHVRKAQLGATRYRAAYASTGRRLIKEAAVITSTGLEGIVFDQFDPVGRELVRRDLGAGETTTRSAYTPLGELDSSVVTNGVNTVANWHFRYDNQGNLLLTLNESDVSAGAVLVKDPSDHDRVCRIDYGVTVPQGATCNVGYDALGNIRIEPAHGGPRQFTYFDSGLVRTIRQAGGQARFAYDPFGDVQKLDVVGFPGQEWHESRFGDLIDRRELGGSGPSIITRNIPGPGGILASRRGAGDDWTFTFGEMRGNRYFTDQGGNPVQSVTYAPFGKATSTGATPPSGDYTSAQWNAGSALIPFGLSQLGARLYDPGIGRFLSRDPLLLARGSRSSHPYAFAVNDPVNAADPSGLDSCGSDDLCISYTYSPDPTPASLLSLVPAAIDLIGQGLAWLTGGSSPAAAAPPVSSGPQTPQGVGLMLVSQAAIGYTVKGFNYDTAARSGTGWSDLIDQIANVDSPERDAMITAYNAPLDRAGSFFSGFGDTVWFWCPGCAARARQDWGISSGSADGTSYTIGSVTGIIFSLFAFGEPGDPEFVIDPPTPEVPPAPEPASSPPKIVMGDVKSINSYKKGLMALSEMEGRGIYNTNGNTALGLYDPQCGDVCLQIFGSEGNGPRSLIWEDYIGTVEIPVGLSPVQIGNAVEAPVRELIGRFLGQDFLPKAANAPGPDLVPRIPP